VVVKELMTNGKLRTVTKDSRDMYCECYMDYFMKTSIQKQFKAFQEGFMRVCEEKVLVREKFRLLWHFLLSIFAGSFEATYPKGIA